jgi:uncharacterized repeat protein (TIGR01451 family)
MLVPIRVRLGRAAGAVAPAGGPRRRRAALAAAAMSLLAVSLVAGQAQASMNQANVTGANAARAAVLAASASNSPASASTSAELVIPSVAPAGIAGFAGSWGTAETGPDGGLDQSEFPDPDAVQRYLSAATAPRSPRAWLTRRSGPPAPTSCTSTGRACARAARGTLTVTNHGRGAAADSVVSDVLPAGLMVTGAPGGCTLSGRALTCDLGTLAPGATRTVTLDTTVTAAAGSAVQNCANATTTTADPDQGNNSACAQAIVPVPPARADLAVSKVGPGLLVAGDIARYRITVTNHGPQTARDVVMTDVLAESLTAAGSRLCAGTGRTISCSIGTLEPGESRSVVLATRVAPDADPGSVTGNCASAVSAAFDPDQANGHSCAETIVERPPTAPDDADLAVTKSASASVLPGNAIRYTLAVVNYGPGAAHDTFVGDTIPAGLFSVTTPAGCTLSDRILNCRLGSLAPGATRTFTLTGTLTTSAAPNSVVENCMVAYTTTPEKSPVNNAACTRTLVQAGPPTVPVTG